MAYSLSTLAVAVWAFAKLVRVARHHQFVSARARAIAPDKMPSVSVCIPARNEEHAMARCLDSVIASDYPKLEIIVVDDHSVDNTSTLVKSYANEGVRFIKSKDLPEGWVGRNYAYESLREQASGKYILFLSVDTHIGEEAISKLVAYMMHKQVEMVSVLPSRLDGYRLSVLFAPLRHLQEILCSSRANPPTVSGGWLVNRELLEQHFTDLSDLKADILIERHIARRFAAVGGGGYDFIVNAHACDISFEKHWSSQVETSIRIYAMSTAGHLLSFLGIVLLLLLVALLPVMIALLCVLGCYAPAIVSIFAELAFMAMFTYYSQLVWLKGVWLAWICWPIVSVQEVAILIVSAVKRARGTVTWKGRPVFSK
ncbi:MAG: glycosyltransferase family 2 protein [Candidatus Nomurabacteria bacterium]|nr:glycosyltransferase family 2 protein [Candidatus Nomurabacteria bacterium]